MNPTNFANIMVRDMLDKNPYFPLITNPTPSIISNGPFIPGPILNSDGNEIHKYVSAFYNRPFRRDYINNLKNTLESLDSPTNNNNLDVTTEHKIIYHQPVIAGLSLKPPTIGLNSPFDYRTHFILDNDYRTVNKIVEYVYNKTTHKWLYNELGDILNYFKVDNDKVKVSDSKLNNENLSRENKEKIVRFIKKYYLTESMILRLIRKYCSATNTPIVEVPYRLEDIKKALKFKLKKLIKLSKD